MSRRRGVIVSDDEGEAPRQRSRVVSSQRSAATAETKASSSSKGKKGAAAKESTKEVTKEILNLPSVTSYRPEEIQALLAFKDDSKKLSHAITASFNVISTSSLAVAELKDADGKSEVTLHRKT
jgi:hypothetical protein